MVDVSAKAETARVAVARGRVVMAPATLARIREGGVGKGDVLGVARLAGIMAAKRTADLIPLCHPLPLTRVAVDLAPAPPDAVEIEATVGAHRPDRRGDGGADRRDRRGADGLRHVQGGRPRHADRGGAPGRASPAASPATTRRDAMIPVEEARARILAGARARRRPRRCRWPRPGPGAGAAGARPPDPAAGRRLRHGRLRGARRGCGGGRRAARDRQRPGGPSLRGRGRPGRGGAHLHRRRRARGRRCASCCRRTPSRRRRPGPRERGGARRPLDPPPRPGLRRRARRCCPPAAR